MSDIDKYALERAWGVFCATIPSETWSNDLETAAKAVTREIEYLECEEDHCSGHFSQDFSARTYLWDLLAKVRLGVYDESIHGNLREILETIERMANE